MWVRSVSLRKNTERISKYEIYPGAVHVAVPGCFFFWQVFVVRPPICTFYLKYWDKGFIAFA